MKYRIYVQGGFEDVEFDENQVKDLYQLDETDHQLIVLRNGLPLWINMKHIISIVPIEE